jgi:hypothetical protein
LSLCRRMIPEVYWQHLRARGRPRHRGRDRRLCDRPQRAWRIDGLPD